MSAGGVWVTEADVVDAIDLTAAIAALQSALPAQIGGSSSTMEKTHVSWGGGHTLHALGGTHLQSRIVGVKAWAHAGGAEPLLVLWDADDGHCVAIIEAFALGQLRTAAMTAIATRWMSAADSSILAVIGSGRQAAAQLAAVMAVRRITEVRIYSPTSSHRDAFAGQLRSSIDIEIEIVVADSVAEAVESADIVTTVTRAVEPFLFGADVKAGAHINAVGAITPERRELAPSLVERCSVVVTDSARAARHLAVELNGVDEILELAEIVGHPISPEGAGLSLFKPMGLGLADVILGTAALDAVGLGGRAIPAPVRHKPRLYPQQR